MPQFIINSYSPKKARTRVNVYFPCTERASFPVFAKLFRGHGKLSLLKIVRCTFETHSTQSARNCDELARARYTPHAFVAFIRFDRARSAIPGKSQEVAALSGLNARGKKKSRECALFMP